MRRWAGVAVTVAVCCTPAAAMSPAAGSDGCEGAAGVTVVVDPGPLGGQADRRCVPDVDRRMAAALIAEAGFSITYVSGQPFLCRIDGRPDAAQEDCANTPPGNAYWGLFWADDRSRGWTYSTLGAAALEVPEGGAVGLRFQDGGDREDPAVPPSGKGGAGEALDAAANRVDPNEPTPGSQSPWLTWIAGSLVAGLAVALLAASRRPR